jgi:hypothetical protein
MATRRAGVSSRLPRSDQYSRDAYSGNPQSTRWLLGHDARVVHSAFGLRITVRYPRHRVRRSDVRDQLYELLADWERPTREWAAGPKNNAILSTVMSRERRAVAGRQALGSSWASNVDAFDEMELPGGQRGKMSFSVEVGPKLGKRLAKRRRFVRRKGGASDPWINS